MKKRIAAILSTLVVALTLAAALSGSAEGWSRAPSHVYVGVYTGSGSASWRDLAEPENVGKVFYDADHTGYVTYDGAGKLMMSDYRMTGSQYYYDSKEDVACGIYVHGGDLTIEVSGSCSITPTCDAAQKKVYGIRSAWPVTIQNADNDEPAVLTIHTQKSAGQTPALEAYGIGCYGTLTVKNNLSGSITVNATGDAAGTSDSNWAKSFGVYAVRADIKSGTVNAWGGEPSSANGEDNISYGFCANDSLAVSGRAVVTGTAGKAFMSRGVDSNSMLTLSGFAELTGFGGAATENTENTVGVECADLLCTGYVKLTGTGGDAYERGASIGLRVIGGSFELDGGTVTATGGDVGGNANSHGFDMWKGSLTLKSGKLICTGGRSACPPGYISTIGAYCGSFLNVTGGEMTVKSGFGPTTVGLYFLKLDAGTEPGIAVTGSGLVTVQAGVTAIKAHSNAAEAEVSASGYIRGGRSEDGDDAVPYGTSCSVPDFKGCSYVVLEGASPAFSNGRIERVGGKLRLSYNVRMVRGGTKYVVVARYDDDGRLLGADFKQYEGFPAKNVGNSLALEEVAAEYRLFFLDGTNFAPLCETWTINAGD